MNTMKVEVNMTRGKYPKADFVGILKTIFPSTAKSGTPILKIQCQDESEIMVTGLGQVTEESTPDFMGTGKFVESLVKAMTAAGIKDVHAFWHFDHNEIVKFTTEPDYVGLKCQFKRTEQKKVGTEETEFPPEWTVEKTESPKSDAKPGKLPSKPEIPVEDLIEKWKEVLESMPTPLNEAGLARYLKVAVTDDKLRKSMSDARKKVLESLVIDGFLDIEDGKYKVI